MKKVLTLIAMAVLGSVYGGQVASAHFVARDKTTGVEAVYHVTPDHSPIAGKESVISFDFSKTNQQTRHFTYVLKVKSTKEEVVTVPVEVAGNVVMGDYTFPARGYYNVSLLATDQRDGTVSTLRYDQRVSRGVTEQGSEQYIWLIIGGLAMVGMLTIGTAIAAIVLWRKPKPRK